MEYMEYVYMSNDKKYFSNIQIIMLITIDENCNIHK
jgi:hypothetical protein